MTEDQQSYSTFCVVPRCDVTIDSTNLMCAAHWRLVPAELQRDVKRHDQDRVAGVSGATLRWTKAASAAVEAVEERSGKEGRHAAAC